MAVSRLSDPLRKRIHALLADDRGEADRLLGALRALRAEEDAPVFAAALHLLARLDIPEIQAERLLGDLLRHRDAVSRALGRDPGLRVAAIDYLSNVKRLLTNPAVLESSELEQTERRAVTDPLTRLYNRRFFSRSLALELRRSHRYSLRLSLLMLDLDAFKLLNDRHGHMFGDLVLQRVGQVLRRAVRDADTPCRYGGEEFVVILPETDRLGAYAVAERIREHVARSFREKPVGGRHVTVSISGGIASYPLDGEDSSSLISRADQALYVAKELGKNRVSMYHSERRRAIRYPAKTTSRVRVHVDVGREPFFARPLNISIGGALLDVENGLEETDGLELVFGGRDAAGRRREWVCTARVVRVEHRGAGGASARVAVAFDEPLSDECLLQQVQRTRILRAVQGGRG